MIKRRERFINIQNFAVYYGNGAVCDLEKYNAVIIEPLGQKQEDIQRLQDQGVLVIAYLSILEVEDWYEECQYLSTADYLYLNGKPVFNPDFHNKVLDIRSLKWRRILLHKIGKLFNIGKFDGLFLDTLGWVEIPESTALPNEELLYAMAAFIAEVRTRYPDHLLIQNNGLEYLVGRTAEWIDGVCWENPDFGNKQATSWNERIINMLGTLQMNRQLKILILAENKSPRSLLSSRIAARNGFLFFLGGQNYQSGLAK